MIKLKDLAAPRPIAAVLGVALISACIIVGVCAMRKEKPKQSASPR